MVPKFLEDVATIAEPLTALMKKDRRYEWGDTQQEAFEKIKALLSSAPVVARPSFEIQFVVQTDASDTGIGAVLLQIIDGQERVLEFASRTLSPAERNYSVTERECLAVISAITKFRPYIEWYHFLVVTDHSSLRWLHSLHSPTGRLARWALELQGHSFDVEHRMGALNHVPDALSRMFDEDDDLDMCASTWSDDTNDEWYQSWLSEVTRNPTTHPRWKAVGGRLFNFLTDEIVEAAVADDEAWNLVVPQERRREVLRESHDDRMAGHQGREKTYERAARLYYWPKMYHSVKRYVKQCQVCQQTKTVQRPPAGLMGQRVIDGPWQVVAGDITGPIVKSKFSYEYIFVFQDLFTRWVECIPIRKANAKAVLKEFKERVVLRFGTPEVFLSDNGTEFKNKAVDEYLAGIGVHHFHHAAISPAGEPCREGK